MVPFESLGMVSYLLYIVTMAIALAISEIFSIKEWFDLDGFGLVQSHSKWRGLIEHIRLSIGSPL